MPNPRRLPPIACKSMLVALSITEMESGNAFLRSDHAAIIDEKTFSSVSYKNTAGILRIP